jgi:formylmethanofuran dehydrogenase subunit A
MNSRPLLIQGGKVIDPISHAGIVERDVLVHEGKIVATLPDGLSPEVINATGMLVMPAGVDMHTHIASTGVNLARQMQSGVTFAGQPLVPSTFDTGRLYSAMGYTTAIEAAVSPSDARMAHLQLEDTPNLDSGILTLIDNNETLIELIEKKDYPAARAFVAQMLHCTGALGMKVVNPAGVASWRRDPACSQIQTLDQLIPGCSYVTPRRILQTLTQISEDLNLPHPTHIHGNRLGEPGNAQILMESIRAMEGRRAHIAHLQFYGYGATKKGQYTSAAQELCAFLEAHPNVTADVGMVMFGDAFTITADTPLEYGLWQRTGSVARPAVFIESECEAGVGVMPASYDRTNRVHSLQWAIGLELLLLAKNPWQICLSIDHPNGGSFLHYPTIIAMLMNKALRDEALAKAHPWARKHSSLAQIDREMTLEEIAIITRAAPARMLGIDAIKGSLMPDTDADLTICTFASEDSDTLFRVPDMVIRGGTLIAKCGKVVQELPGRRLRAKITVFQDDLKASEHRSVSDRSICPTQFGLTTGEIAQMRQITRKH